MENASTSDIKPQSTVLRIFAHFFSIIFHPLFITSYVMYFLLFVHPLAFAGLDSRLKTFRLITVVLVDTWFPAFATFLLWRLKLGVQSIHLPTKQERIIPYIAAMTFYWWTWHVFNNIPDNPPSSVHFLLGAFLAVCGAFFCNIYFKISMHSIAVGGLAMFFIFFSFTDGFSSGLYLALSLIIAGIVCTSRLIVSDHTPFEIYFGLFIGALAQFIAWQF
ncbi:MAG TPA: hypothetical protein VKT28_19855 [Puia sp.]|nr:hypothetical protein [Puia sp.]